MRSFPSGPKIAVKVATSKLPAASIRASAACCGVSKVRAPAEVPEAEDEAGLGAPACDAERIDANRATATPEATRAETLKNEFTSTLFMTRYSSPQTYQRLPPPPRRAPPPPDERMLELPRLLLARALDPL